MTVAAIEANIMAKKPAPSGEQEPPSETVRVAGDLVEMLREMCFHTRDERNRRPKLAQLLDTLLRPVVTREYAAFKRRPKQEPEGD